MRYMTEGTVVMVQGQWVSGLGIITFVNDDNGQIESQ